MTGTFKANNSYNNFLLYSVCAVVKITNISVSKNTGTSTDRWFFVQGIIKMVATNRKQFSGYLCPDRLFFVIYSGRLFNKLVNDQRIMQRPNYLTGMSYLLITSLFMEWNVLSSPLIINSLLIWVWAKMSGLYSNPKPKTALFNIGIAIGICTLFLFSVTGICSIDHFRTCYYKAI